MSFNLFGDSSEEENDQIDLKEEEITEEQSDEEQDQISENEEESFDIQEDVEEEEEKEEEDNENDTKDDLDDIPLEDVPIGEPIFVKPFDYKKLKQKKQERGVIFVTSPPEEYCNEQKLGDLFGEYGVITRIKTFYQVKGKRKLLLGYYIEFERKSVAKRVSLTLNLQPIKKHDSRLLQIKYIPNFEWTEIEEEEDRKKLRKNLLIAEAQKELRELKMYENYKKWSDKIKKTKKTPESLKNFHFAQKKVKAFERPEDLHLRFLPIFKKQKTE